MEITSILMTIYEQFIEYCKTENFDSEYYEKHHIVPKHSGGTDDKENLIYLPPYSPDLNPIEKFWANFKRNLRKVIKQFDDFLNAITFAMHITQSG